MPTHNTDLELEQILDRYGVSHRKPLLQPESRQNLARDLLAWRDKTAKPQSSGCNGAHCKCMERSCPNFHHGDHICPYETSTPLSEGEDELRNQIREVIGFETPEYIESVGVSGVNLPAARFEKILDGVMQLVAPAIQRAELKARANEAGMAEQTCFDGQDVAAARAVLQKRRQQLEAEISRLQPSEEQS